MVGTAVERDDQDSQFTVRYDLTAKTATVTALPRQAGFGSRFPMLLPAQVADHLLSAASDKLAASDELADAAK